MKVIVAGSRNITDENLIFRILSTIHIKHQISITEVVSGRAKGVDSVGEKWAQNNGISTKLFPAKWNDLTAPNTLIRKNRYGDYNARAGFDRNESMAVYSDMLIAFWDGSSNGTAHMIQTAKKHKLTVFLYTTYDQALSMWKDGYLTLIIQI